MSSPSQQRRVSTVSRLSVVFTQSGVGAKNMTFSVTVTVMVLASRMRFWIRLQTMTVSQMHFVMSVGYRALMGH